MSPRQAAKVIAAILELLKDTMAKGGEVNLPGFGKFSVAQRAARQGVNPSTGERIEIAETTVPKFTAASALKAALRDGDAPQEAEAMWEEDAPRRSASRPSARKSAKKSDPDDAERHINAWIPGRGAAGTRRAPLVLGEPYDLMFDVGDLIEGGLLDGDMRVRDSELPPEGLDTEWSLSSTTVDLSVTGFLLHVPKEGQSDTRSVRVTAREAGAEIEVIISARGEAWRQFTVRLPVAQAGARSSRRSAARVEDEFIRVPAGHLGVQPPHEWQTPNEWLFVTVGSSDAFAKGWAGGEDVNEPTRWSGWETNAKGPIQTVRAAAERFRAQWEGYLNDLPLEDLQERFARPRGWHGGEPPGPVAHPRFDKAWRAARRSQELKDLAAEGHILYETFFPRGTDLRRWVDALSPGSLLDVTWLNDQPGYIAQVPWGLMYQRGSGAVDPASFLGLRLRLSYTTHRVQRPSRALGDADAVYCGNYLYWGTRDGDDTATEAAWQRDEFERLDRQLIWPAEGSANAKKDLVKALGKPAPAPVAVLYMFCQSNFGQTRDPVLAFDDPAGPGCSLANRELGTTPLRAQPFVFANACTSAAGAPDMANELQETFFRRGARAFLGTETKVPIQFASRFARIYFHYFYREADPAPMAAGEALHQARQFLWNHYRNIGGLFYSHVNQYKLYLASDQEVRSLGP